MYWVLKAVSLGHGKRLEVAHDSDKAFLKPYSVFDCGFQSETVNCRLFWQFSGLEGGETGAGWAASGSSKVARCVEAVCEIVFCVPTSWRLSERLPRYGWRHLSLHGVVPIPKSSPDSASCLHSGWTLLLFYYYFLSFTFSRVFVSVWGRIRRIVKSLQAQRRDQQISISVIEDRKFTWLVQWSLTSMFTGARQPESDKGGGQRWA
jgi:hypothetical protein